jgi:glycosyltransferase involved in cell wall biosynthesis
MVLPSVFDPGATVVLEAMASGKAVVAVKWGGPADILDASCGILIEPRDPASLVADLEQAIVSLANDRNRCASMGRAGRAKVLAEYTWPMKIERFIEIYREAINGFGGRRTSADVSLLPEAPPAPQEKALMRAQ